MNEHEETSRAQAVGRGATGSGRANMFNRNSPHAVFAQDEHNTQSYRRRQKLTSSARFANSPRRQCDLPKLTSKSAKTHRDEGRNKNSPRKQQKSLRNHENSHRNHKNSFRTHQNTYKNSLRRPPKTHHEEQNSPRTIRRDWKNPPRARDALRCVKSSTRRKSNSLGRVRTHTHIATNPKRQRLSAFPPLRASPRRGKL